MKTPKPLLTLRMVFPAAASLIVLLLGEWIARGSLTADTFASFIFPHIGAYLLAWLLLFLVWMLLDWIFRFPPLSTLGMAVLGCAPCAVNFYTLQLRGEPFLPWDLMQVSEAAGVASAAGIKIQTSMIVTIVVVLVLMVGSFSCTAGGISSGGCPVWRAVRPPLPPSACWCSACICSPPSPRCWASRRTPGCRTAITAITASSPAL